MTKMIQMRFCPASVPQPRGPDKKQPGRGLTIRVVRGGSVEDHTASVLDNLPSGKQRPVNDRIAWTVSEAYRSCQRDFRQLWGYLPPLANYDGNSLPKRFELCHIGPDESFQQWQQRFNGM